MKKLLVGFLILVLFSVCCKVVSADPAASGSAASDSGTIMSADSVKWSPVPNLPGVQMAVMYGDPTQSGSQYTMRLKFPDGYQVPVHWHNDTERLTVLSGTGIFGIGHSIDPSKGTPISAGSFIVVPANVHHWLVAKSGLVVQTSGVGPFTMNLMK